MLDGELYETVENINRGSCLFDITVQYDYAIYKFDGWYADNTYTRKWDFTQDRIWEDMKIYGRTVDTRITGINRIYPWINDARIYDESNDIIITTTLQRPDSISLDGATYRRLKALSETGGNVVFVNRRPVLCEGNFSNVADKIPGEVVDNRRGLLEKYLLVTGQTEEISICF